MAKHECQVQVYRNGQLETTQSSSIVPGDIIEIEPSDEMLPCDMILLSGQCIVNESTLTGESTPITKNPLPMSTTTSIGSNIAGSSTDTLEKQIVMEDDSKDDIEDGVMPFYSATKHKAYTLFAGTKVIQIRKLNGEAKARALVTRTAFATSRGRLVLSILYPKPTHFRFYRDSLYFVGCLAGLAIIGFIITIACFIHFKVVWHRIIIQCLDLVTIVVPPTLPVAMTVGTAYALRRLKKQKIYCISPPRVNFAGTVKLMCFDKTGTLTEDDLDLFGIRPTSPPQSSSTSSCCFDLLVQDCSHFSNEDNLFRCLATCHSLVYINDDEVANRYHRHKGLLGDPLEVKIFEALSDRCTLMRNEDTDTLVTINPDTIVTCIDPTTQTPNCTLCVLKRFDFSSKHQRMSVLVQAQGASGQLGGLTLYTKGSPEKIKHLALPNTIPSDYDEILYRYAHEGYRVLACAYRPIDISSGQNFSPKRKDIERDLIFLGFVIMKNCVKPATKPTIETLTKAHIRSVMVTGDNPYTAVSVARECGIIRTHHPHEKLHAGTKVPWKQPVYLGHVVRDVATESEVIEWSDIDNPSNKLDALSLKPAYEERAHYKLAVTGAAFDKLLGTDMLKHVLLECDIYARMSPDQKTRLVQELQAMDYYVGMCGDGANDSGALKAAHVGISLAEAQASVAAPFTYTKPSIECVPTLLREGRAALSTSFQSFKYMALYSIIQFTSVIILYTINSNIGDYQFLSIDLVILLPIVVLMSRTGPVDELGAHTPPTSLLTLPVFLSLFGQIAFSVAFQLIAILDLTRQPWYVPLDPIPGEWNIACHVNAVVFTMSQFEYLSVATAYSIGRPWRKSIFSNKLYVLLLAVLITYCSYLVVHPDDWTQAIMELDNDQFSFWFRMRFIGYVALNFILCWTWERVMVVGPGWQWFKKSSIGAKLRRENRSYKLLNEEGTNHSPSLTAAREAEDIENDFALRV
eukprot:GEZU01026547.1.p1 GENE.GEZU01026547.1~~GEZU01026547.1.p1  ORF type:complete len:1107 (+),score=113.23 GEZU01026547.1:410-3322(+)